MKHFLISIIALATLISCGGAEERKEVYLEKARQSLAAGNLDKARIELRNVLQIDPKEAQAHFQLGEIFDLKKEYTKAFVSYSKAVELDPENLDYHAKIGTYVLILAGDVDTAIEKRDLILSKDPSNISGLLLKSGILMKQNNKDEAEKIAKDIFSMQPGHVHNALFLSSIYLNDKKYDESINVLNTCIKENAENRSLVSALANAYFKAEKYDLAENVYRGILEKNPEVFSNYMTLASFYKEIGSSDKAESVLRNAIENNAEDVTRKIVLVDFIQQTRGNQSAIEELKNIIEKNKNAGELRLSLARYYASEKKLDEAVQILKTAVADFSEESVGIKSRAYLANIYMQNGDVDAAINVINDAIKISPNDSEVNFINAKLKIVKKDYEAAIISLRIVTKDDPENIDAYFLLAAAHSANGEAEQAGEIIKRAYENNRTNANALIALARYHDKNKNIAELEKMIDSLISMRPNDYEILSYKSALLNKKKMLPEAKAHATRLIELYPDMPNGYIQSVPFLLTDKKESEAISLLEQGYTRVKEKTVMLDSLVSVYFAQKNFGAAENKVKSTIGEIGDTAELHMLLARIQWSSGKKEAAKSSLLKASSIKPEWNQPYLNLADAYKAENNAQKAIEILQQGLIHVQGDLSLILKLTEIYEGLGDYNAAINQYEKAYDTHTENVVLANNLAALLSLHRTDEASLKRARQLADKLKTVDQAVILDTAGWVYFKVGDYVEAVNILKTVVEKSPDVPVFNYHLGMALYKTGDEVSAKAYLTKALATDGSFPGRDEAETHLKKIQ